jgi:hypothetical protein
MVTSPPPTVMPIPVVIVKRSISRIVETSVSPVVGDADISCPIMQHVTRQTEISLPIYRQISSSGVSGGLSYARVPRLCRLHTIGSLSVCTREISLAI